MSKAQEIATELGDLTIALGAGVANDGEWVQAETNRLKRKTVLPLSQVKELHEWLDEKRKARQSCRIVGESRTGKNDRL